MLVFLDVESRVVVPAEGNCKLESLEAVQVDALVRASTHSGISVGQELVLVRLECGPSFVRTFLKDNDHECAHKECRVCLLCIVE